MRCCDPLFPLRRRFTQLETISIGGRLGNGAGLQWDSPAAAAVIPKFTSLRLELRGDPEWDGSLVLQKAPITSVPATWLPAMAAATRLSSLELHAAWSMAVPLLCAALPALATLRCGCKLMIWPRPLAGCTERCPTVRTAALRMVGFLLPACLPAWFVPSSVNKHRAHLLKP